MLHTFYTMKTKCATIYTKPLFHKLIILAYMLLLFNADQQIKEIRTLILN